jgi:Holliday junction resolvase-like predicted endonuclease
MKFGLPQESIAPYKVRRLLQTARWYLAEQGIAEDCYILRFDLVTIYRLVGKQHINWLQDIIKIM